MINRTSVFTATLLISNIFSAHANDGAFFARGNQLIPINDKDISIKKEILSITQKDGEMLINVYYEFYNPGASKEVLVGFEASSPDGDVDGTPINGQHPYMYDFTVAVNDQPLPYEVAIVEQEAYIKRGMPNTLSETEINARMENINEVGFNYVYHFNAIFKKGLNVIKHTYRYKTSKSMTYYYLLDYILTSANRWANNQIDDFTLVLDMGNNERFHIANTFFNAPSEWTFSGIGKSSFVKMDKFRTDYYEPETDLTFFAIKNGAITFNKKNFRPAGELILRCEFDDILAGSRGLRSVEFEDSFNYKTDYLSFYGISNQLKPVDQLSKKIIQNYPFAKRGYIFKDKILDHYFRNTVDWYIPDPKYLHPIERMDQKEKNILRH